MSECNHGTFSSSAEIYRVDESVSSAVMIDISIMCLECGALIAFDGVRDIVGNAAKMRLTGRLP